METNSKKPTKENSWEDSDLLVKARVSRSDIQLLVKYVEGLGHLGVVTTIDRFSGEVLIQTTKDCWPELKKNIENLPIVTTTLE
jgi:hypothetical protein